MEGCHYQWSPSIRRKELFQLQGRAAAHIRQLCGRCLPPGPAIVANNLSHLEGGAPGGNWCSRFIDSHKHILDSRYLNSLNLERNQADYMVPLEQYFSSIGKKIDEYQILRGNKYNMDGNSFLLRRNTKAKRFFRNRLKASAELLGADQDGSREWITAGATIWGDGASLPPLMIYDSTSGSIQGSWVQDISSNEHDGRLIYIFKWLGL